MLQIRNRFRFSDSAMTGHMLALACAALGQAYETAGDYWRAELHLREGVRAHRRWGFLPLGTLQGLGNLLWLSGQLEAALEAHCDPDLRQSAESTEHLDYFLRSHLAAGKCALDLRQRELFAGAERPELLGLATEELAAARRLLDEHPETFPWWLEGYYTVYSGQLAIHRDDDIEVAQERYLDAIDLFRSREPVFHTGLMMAKCELVGLEMQDQQTHLRSRIERLKPLLKRSCYHDLFSEYVEKRYVWAAEERWLEEEARFDLDGIEETDGEPA